MEEEGIGAKFWLWLAGVLFAGAAILFVTILLFSHAIYEWGFLGGLLVFAAACVGVAWIFDRRNKRRLDWEAENPEHYEGERPNEHLERF
jgi:4-hydroxybenzoate polyprenyltransferase